MTGALTSITVDGGEKSSNGIENGHFSLENILGANHESLEHPGIEGAPASGWDEETPDTQAAEGFCVECEGDSLALICCLDLKNLGESDQPAQVLCETCADNYCEVCFAAQHRKGSRKGHVVKPLNSQRGKKPKHSQNGSNVSNGNSEVTNGDSVNLFALDAEVTCLTMRDRWMLRKQNTPISNQNW